MSQALFASDEMNALKLEEHWTAEDVLRQEGIFYLKDLVAILELNATRLKARVRQMQRQGRSPWTEMGVKRVWLHWIVRMKVFAPYYRANLIPRDIGKVEDFPDVHQLLQQPGLFYLTDVARQIPFTAQQLRYQANKNPRSREEMGIWKDAELNSFLVHMPTFSKWLKCLWLRD